MKKFTCHILTLNDESVIEDCLKSLNYPTIDVLIGDLGSSDNTIRICKNYNTRILNLNFKNISDARNYIINKTYTDWQLYLLPQERLNSFDLCEMKDEYYNVFIVQDNVISKEVRLWNKQANFKFKNPVYEYLDVPHGNTIDITIGVKPYNKNYKQNINEWIISENLNPIPYYYKAFYCLSVNDYSEFINYSEKYLFHETSKSVPYIMIRYYRAFVFFKFLNNPNTAILELHECINLKKEMAEFWCLLGDIFYFGAKDFSQAIKIYEKAIENGSNRDIKDEFPIEPLKYKDYPSEMIIECTESIKNSKVAIVS